ncbi:MAG: hypothetical protein J6A04_07700 [Clostridia bacterium]|nr:hypothetical protein [Clostridia bacterium]
MVREFNCEERHIHVNVVGVGDVITIPKGVAVNWVLKDIQLDGLYEMNFDIVMATKHHNMLCNKSWYRICRSSNQAILKRIVGASVIGE